MDKTEMVSSDVDRFRLPFSHIRVWFPSCPFPISVPLLSVLNSGQMSRAALVQCEHVKLCRRRH